MPTFFLSSSVLFFVPARLLNGRALLLQLYRDCLRLIRHVAPGETSPKALALRSLVKMEFTKNKNETDEAKIESYKAAAVRALSNYMLATSAPKDPAIAGAMDDYHGRSVKEAANERNEKPNNR